MCHDLVMSWKGSWSWTVSVLLLTHLTHAQSEGNSDGAGEGSWGAVIGLMMALIAVSALFICLLISMCEFHRNRQKPGAKFERTHVPEMIDVEMQMDLEPFQHNHSTKRKHSTHSEYTTIADNRINHNAVAEDQASEGLDGAFNKRLDGLYEVGPLIVSFETGGSIRTARQLATRRKVILKSFDDARSCQREYAFYSSVYLFEPALYKKAQTLLPEILDRGKITVTNETLPALVLESGEFTLKQFIALKRTGHEGCGTVPVKRIFQEICVCVQLLHETGNVIGSLDLETVMLFGDRWKVFDFSCISSFEENIKRRPRRRVEAPEVVRALLSRNATIKARPEMDLWSLGGIAYELITLEPLFPESSYKQEDIEAMCLGNRNFPWEERPEKFFDSIKTPTAATIVKNCLNRDPAKRWTTEMIIQYSRRWA